MNYRETDYYHHAIIANLTTARHHGGRAFERFTDQGPMALLPLPAEGARSRSALVWTLPEELAEEREQYMQDKADRQMQIVTGGGTAGHDQIEDARRQTQGKVQPVRTDVRIS